MPWDPTPAERALSMQFMTWPEIQDRIVGGARTAVFAVGATEQHGPHLPEGVDEFLGTQYALGIAAMLGDALVAPTIRPAMSSAHMEFAGTITLRPQTLTMLIEDYVSSLLQHGFNRLVVVNAHFGNRSTVQIACERLQLDLGSRAIIVPLLQPGMYVPQEPRFAGLTEGFHAHNFETSLMLHFAGGLVQMDKAASDGHYPALVDGLLARFQQQVRAFSKSGVLGNPTLANAATGSAAFEAVVKRMVSDVDQLSAFLRSQRDSAGSVDAARIPDH